MRRLLLRAVATLAVLAAAFLVCALLGYVGEVWTSMLMEARR